MPRGATPNDDLDGLDQICWSCRNSIDQRNGISLLSCDGLGSMQVCETCWEKIPVADRIKLQWLMRGEGAEGIGVVGLISDFRMLVRMLAQRTAAGDFGEAGDSDEEGE